MSNPKELETAELEHEVMLGEALARLNQNPDFQVLILNGYLKEKALASVSLLSVPAIKDAGRRPDIMEDLVASSNLSYWLQTVQQTYEAAIDPILSDEEEAEMLREEQESE